MIINEDDYKIYEKMKEIFDDMEDAIKIMNLPYHIELIRRTISTGSLTILKVHDLRKDTKRYFYVDEAQEFLRQIEEELRLYFLKKIFGKRKGTMA